MVLIEGNTSFYDFTQSKTTQQMLQQIQLSGPIEIIHRQPYSRGRDEIFK